MGLNKPSGNMFPGYWTWNPITGCLFNCSYCYLHDKRLNLDMTPRIVEARFKDNLSKHGPINIFVGSSGDGWANNIPSEWISRVLEYCKRFPDNTYLFSTKQPDGYIPFVNDFPANTILTTTIETDSPEYFYHIPPMSESPLPIYRQFAFKVVCELAEGRYRTMVSLEPIMKHTQNFGLFLLEMDADIYSIGADSKRCGLPEPYPEQIQYLIHQLENAGKEVRLKKNLGRIFHGELTLGLKTMAPSA